MEFDYKKHLVMLCTVGSRAYGTHTPESDYDYRGALVPPALCDSGFLHKFEQKERLAGYGEDSIAYDLRKFFSLCANCNPNVVECLFVPDDLVVVDTKWGRLLRENRYKFLSMRAKDSFHGYAYSQLKRMKNHKAWMDQEKSGAVTVERPKRKAFGLGPNPKYAKEHLQGLVALPQDSLEPSLKDYVAKEREYMAAHNEWAKWNKWRKNRNPQRAAMERKSGYDLKHGMHLVRLLKMCEELLRDGELYVRRPDADFLLEVRNGEWSYEKLMGWVDNQDEVLKALADKSTLPKHPDMDYLNNLCAEMVSGFRKDLENA